MTAVHRDAPLDEVSSAPDTAPSAPVSLARGRYILAILFIVNALNFLDRQLPFILGEAIKRDLGLSDAELGILGGLTFGIVYSLLGLPIARWADRRSQVGILAGAVFVWSIMTSAGAWAQNLGQLALARAGVAVGEAGAAPCSHAIISTVFGPERRGRAIAIFILGLPLGTMVGLFAGGWLADHSGWRTTMLIMGIPGIVMALILALTVRIPKSPAPPAASDESASAPSSMLSVMRHLLTVPRYRWIVLGMIAYGAAYSSFQTFQPSLLKREFALSFSEIGLRLGLLQGLLGGAAIILGGVTGDWLAKRDPRWQLKMPAIALLVSGPLFAAAQYAPAAWSCIALLAIPVAALSFIQPPVFAAVQDLAKDGERATTTATLFFFLTVFGVSTGGLITGAISDAIGGDGTSSLRLALSLTGIAFVGGGLCLWKGASAKAVDGPPQI